MDKSLNLTDLKSRRSNYELLIRSHVNFYEERKSVSSSPSTVCNIYDNSNDIVESTTNEGCKKSSGQKMSRPDIESETISLLM